MKMLISIGYSTQDAIVDENDEYFESINALQFSAKPQDANSPEIILSSNELRVKNWNEKKAIEKLLNWMYSDENSCLHHGFTAEHKNLFAIGISLFVKSGVDKMAENVGFKKALDSDSILLT